MVQGALQCTASACRREYPILDGIPILLDALRAYVQTNALMLLQRDDLDPTLGTLLGDCLGPGSAHDTLRQHVSHYAEDHWAEHDPVDPGPPSAAATLAEGGLAHLAPTGRGLDLGCGTGRTTFTLADRAPGLVLGVDLHFAMLRVATGVLRRGRARWGRRRTGLVYTPRDVAVSPDSADKVDFWVADATALPLPDGSAGTALSLNLLDCTQRPHAHLAELTRVLAPGGGAVLASPYDWSPSATPVEQWVGGHSQRGADQGDPAARVRAWVDAEPTLTVRADDDRVPWRVRLHDRCTVAYAVHRMVVQRG